MRDWEAGQDQPTEKSLNVIERVLHPQRVRGRGASRTRKYGETLRLAILLERATTRRRSDSDKVLEIVESIKSQGLSVRNCSIFF